MFIRLKALFFELELSTPDPVQISPMDIVSAAWSAMAHNPQQILITTEDDYESGE
ncbi:hypothetical protein [Nocardia wallacei]|uniref:hypothetical protein n=1 Tax=Nocardia wallacei TaxID=480035 RepID=UPI0024552EB1|nr:hypothetical protein [Nocardia wallacei]